MDNVQQEIELEIELEKDIDNKKLKDRLDFIILQLKEKKLVQEENDFYNKLFKQKGVYILNKEYVPEFLITQMKLYQLAIKRLYDNKQTELLDKVTLPILEKVLYNNYII